MNQKSIAFILKLPRAIALLICCCVLLVSCRNTKHLKPGEVLYKGSSIKISSDEKIKGKKSLQHELEENLYPKPNKKFLGMFRTGLWYYNIAGEVKKKKGLKYWLKYVIGTPPVLLSAVNPETESAQMEQKLENKGFFNSKVSHEIKERNRKAKVIYKVDISEAYTIGKILFPGTGWEVANAITKTAEYTLLQTGANYDLELLKKERERIDKELKELGYFYFRPDYILFKADTSTASRTVNLAVTIKTDIPHEATRVYQMNKIYVYPDYSLDIDSVVRPGDTVLINGYYYIKRHDIFKPWVIIDAIALKPGNPYTREDHELTLNRLTNLGVFKFVNMRFSIPEDCEDESKLDCYVYLTPTLKKSVRLELRGVSKSNDFAGPAVTASFRNRNVRRGAELFILNFNAAYESQLKKKSIALHTYEAGIDGRIIVPRIIAPFNIAKNNKALMPKTQIIGGVSRVSRLNIFDMNTFNAVYGYLWKENNYKQHELNPVSVNYLTLTNTSERFRELLDKNLLLRKSFEEQFILGGIYTYIFNNQTDVEKKNHFYFKGNVDLSGNTVHLVEKLIIGKIGATDLFGGGYSQYSRFEADLRYYHPLNEKSKLVTRLLSGIGIPYGNSETLPYIKQFFSGGTNSVRAFAARSIGPGSYSPSENETGIFNQPGDIRLEGNIEYRFDITSVIKGALFTDAGNVWLIKKDPAFPGGEFNAGKFLKQLAIGGGAGIRFDASFFIIRFDVAVPFRKPYSDPVKNGLATEDRTNLLGNKNYILNVAIGYPF